MEILGLVDISTTWIFIVGVLLLLYLNGKRRNRLFKDLGIPGPEPVIYIGNFHHFIQNSANFENVFQKKYGDVYGMFMGGFPLITVSDPEIIREVLVKNFQNFTNRLNIGLDDYPIDKGLFFIDGAEWKRIRHIASPTFSGAKLRVMCDRINKCARSLTDNFIKAAADKSEITIKEYFDGFTMDVIASTGFGIESETQTDRDSQLMREARKVFAGTSRGNPLIIIGVMFPSTLPFLKSFGVSTFPKSSLKYFRNIITEMIEQRKAAAKTKEKRLDFLQLLIDAEDDGTLDDATKMGKESKKMTSDEILGQALLFFTVGYETTANTLHFVSYLLATHPDVQQRLIDEIDTVLGDSEPNYDNIWKVTFLDHVITEALRMFPVVTTVYRKTENTVMMKGYTFPKGTVINIPTLTIHRDPNIYPEPHRFNPDRWEKKSEMQSMNYLPFGHGPRQCIGMRLAQVEMRIALVHVLRKIRFVPAQDTPDVLESKDLAVQGTFTTKKPLKLKAELR